MEPIVGLGLLLAAGWVIYRVKAALADVTGRGLERSFEAAFSVMPLTKMATWRITPVDSEASVLRTVVDTALPRSEAARVSVSVDWHKGREVVVISAPNENGVDELRALTLRGAREADPACTIEV